MQIRVTIPPPPATIPPISLEAANEHALGPDDAYVTVIEYGDFQCVECAEVARALEILRERYPDDVRIVWRHFPQIEVHDKAALALQAAEAASAQGKFWQMHDLLFLRQANWLPLTTDEFRDVLNEYAAELELDVDAFSRAVDSGEYAHLVEESREAAFSLGLAGIPSLVFNGALYSGEYNERGLDVYTRYLLLGKRQYDAPPPPVIDPELEYRAIIETAHGEITIELFPRDATLTVNSFVFLAQEGWYDGVRFFRVIPGFVAQTGDPSNTGFGGPGYTIPDEPNVHTFDRPGMVAVASIEGQPNSGGSQFFITLAALPELNGRFTIFGRVIDGFEVLGMLTPCDPFGDPDAPPGDLIDAIRIEVLR